MKTNMYIWSYFFQLFLEWEIFQTGVVEKVKAHNFFKKKSNFLWDNVEKILWIPAGHRWQYGACALHAGYLRLQAHTHNM